ncbi:MAG TPA: hypothetical protein VIM61_09670 [Chthoniobacterales bacterium]
MSRQSTLAEIADAFGRCAAASLGGETRAIASRMNRLRKIARLLDRLSRRPANRLWHRRAAKVHHEIDLTLRQQARRVSPTSLWARA